MAADLASDPVLMKQEYMCAIHAVWTGTPAGNFTIETTCDVGVIDPQNGAVTGLTNWTTYPDSTQAAGGGGGTFIWHINVLPDPWVRLKYTSSSGTGTLNVRFNAKGV